MYTHCIKYSTVFASTISKESQKYSTVSEAISQPFPSTQLPEMLNKLGITSGARMARIFIYLLRKSDSADFPNP